MNGPENGLPDVYMAEEAAEGGGNIHGACICVPDGEYEVRYIDYETAFFFGNPKVVLHCAIVVPEQYAGLPVDRYFNVLRLIGPPRRFGNYDAPTRGDLVREFRQVVKEPDRTDRISFRPLRHRRLIVELETVKTDYHHNALPRADQYSRVKRLVRVLPDDNW